MGSNFERLTPQELERLLDGDGSVHPALDELLTSARAGMPSASGFALVASSAGIASAAAAASAPGGIGGLVSVVKSAFSKLSSAAQVAVATASVGGLVAAGAVVASIATDSSAPGISAPSVSRPADGVPIPLPGSSSAEKEPEDRTASQLSSTDPASDAAAPPRDIAASDMQELSSSAEQSADDRAVVPAVSTEESRPSQSPETTEGTTSGDQTDTGTSVVTTEPDDRTPSETSPFPTSVSTSVIPTSTTEPTTVVTTTVVPTTLVTTTVVPTTVTPSGVSPTQVPTTGVSTSAGTSTGATTTMTTTLATTLVTSQSTVSSTATSSEVPPTLITVTVWGQIYSFPPTTITLSGNTIAITDSQSAEELDASDIIRFLLGGIASPPLPVLPGLTITEAMNIPVLTGIPTFTVTALPPQLSTSVEQQTLTSITVTSTGIAPSTGVRTIVATETVGSIAPTLTDILETSPQTPNVTEAGVDVRETSPLEPLDVAIRASVQQALQLPVPAGDQNPVPLR